MTTDIDYLLTPVCVLQRFWFWVYDYLKICSFQSFSSVGRKLPLLRVTSSIGWSCGGCSLGWGYCTDRLDLYDLQAPTVAAKALGRTLHVENFSELIWKFEPVRIVRIILFDSVTWGWFPLWAALWAALCFTLPPKLPPRNGSERFRTVLNYCGGVYAWCLGTFGPAFGSFLCVYCCLKWFSRLQSTWEGPEEEGLYNTKKNGCEIRAGDWAFPRLCAAHKLNCDCYVYFY